MGDRCYVELTVLKEHADRVRALLDKVDHSASSDEEAFSDETLHVFGFEEVNYGTLPFLYQLETAGIAHTSRWSGGDEYGAGTKHLRFAPDGTVQYSEYADTEEGKIDTSKLLEFVNASGVTVESIRAYILDHIESFKPLGWEGQGENGKRYLALKLIGGT